MMRRLAAQSRRPALEFLHEKSPPHPRYVISNHEKLSVALRFSL
jgi:hypothetical protein